jgi:hypothetical protein
LPAAAASADPPADGQVLALGSPQGHRHGHHDGDVEIDQRAEHRLQSSRHYFSAHTA